MNPVINLKLHEGTTDVQEREEKQCICCTFVPQEEKKEEEGKRLKGGGEKGDRERRKEECSCLVEENMFCRQRDRLLTNPWTEFLELKASARQSTAECGIPWKNVTWQLIKSLVLRKQKVAALAAERLFGLCCKDHLRSQGGKFLFAGRSHLPGKAGQLLRGLTNPRQLAERWSRAWWPTGREGQPRARAKGVYMGPGARLSP